MLITDYVRISAELYADRIAYSDENRNLDYRHFKNEVYAVSQAIIKHDLFKKPIAVYLDKSVECIVSFLGVACSGNFYTPLDTEMPAERINKIVTTLEPSAFITDRNHLEDCRKIAGNGIVIVYEEALVSDVEEQAVENIMTRICDTDILYILFTSGSTGNPKGVIISHKALLDFTEWGIRRLDINENYVFGNQTPFYFSMSVFDIYVTLRAGATMHIIPHRLFTLPGELMQYMDNCSVNTIFWVPSALTMVSALHALASPHLNTLRNVFFGGEVMPMKQLIRWREEYPDVRYVNFYGPTETTDTCTIYEVNREFEKTEILPIGYACNNKDVFLLDDVDQKITDDKIGELCVRGTGIAYGYYGDPEKTAENFVQNSLNTKYPEKIYRTGDLAKINEYGEFVYVGRKDNQIKHMGHRIELGEIEAVVEALDEIHSVCCMYDSKRQKIVMFYEGEIESDVLIEKLTNKLPAYMLPNKKIKLSNMPKNLNGKIDRQHLKNEL